MNSNNIPQVIQNPNAPNQIDVQFNRNTRFEKVSQSEALRSYALREIESLDWLKVGAAITIACFIGLLLLQVAWLIMPIEPMYHTTLRWILRLTPVVLVPGWMLWLRAALQNPAIDRPSIYMLCVGIGLVGSLAFHKIS